VSTVLLVRHGLTSLTGPVLAGWTPGVDLDERGRAQAAALAARLAGVPVAAVVTSPLERCVQTAAAVVDAQRVAGRDCPSHVDERLGECHYGDWTGRTLKELSRDPMWKVVQAHPSAAVFPGPGGEALAAVQARAVAAVRDWNARLGPDAVWVACSHGDVIKSVLADALALHLDLFQRLSVDPASLSAVHYTPLRPFVVRVNDTGGDVSAFVPHTGRRRRRRESGDAVVGGGPGV
jgi:probable phosphomutase (TIGR03848 family)